MIAMLMNMDRPSLYLKQTKLPELDRSSRFKESLNEFRSVNFFWGGRGGRRILVFSTMAGFCRGFLEELIALESKISRKSLLDTQLHAVCSGRCCCCYHYQQQQ